MWSILAVGKQAGRAVRLTLGIFGEANRNALAAPAMSSWASKSSGGKEPEKSVFISQSADIFSNLALEDWLYRHLDFSMHNVLLVWRNDPCVVIGRHQNPWVEANLPLLKERGITLARRNSGGGTVYHDRGNLNCTFFTTRDGYNRRRNLEIVCRALKREWELEAEITPREDVTLHDYKLISGSASKLGKNAYHHCTVLVNASMAALQDALHNDKVGEIGIESRATSSLSSSVKNLKEALPSVSVEKALAAIGWEYLRTDLQGRDGGKELICKQRGFKMINPTESWFPGLEKLQQDFKSWDWIFGKTPKFTITRSFLIPQELIGGEKVKGSNRELTIQLQVYHGLVEDVSIKIPPEFVGSLANIQGQLDVVTPLKGKRFSEEVVNLFEDLLVNQQPKDKREKNQFVANCMKKVVQSV